MVQSRNNFDNRVNSLGTKRRRLQRGYTMKVDRNGILVAEPKRAIRPYFPVQKALLFLMVFFVLKGFILASHGEDVYNERLASLQNGSLVEAAGATIMGVDPITENVSKFIRPFIK